jgi:hypothetical protein
MLHNRDQIVLVTNKLGISRQERIMIANKDLIGNRETIIGIKEAIIGVREAIIGIKGIIPGIKEVKATSSNQRGQQHSLERKNKIILKVKVNLKIKKQELVTIHNLLVMKKVLLMPLTNHL